MSAKRKNLNLLEKIKLIKESKAKSQRNLASQVGISVGPVNNILKRKREYENLGEENYNPNVKILKRSTNEYVNELTKWFVTARSKNMIVSGPISYMFLFIQLSKRFSGLQRTPKHRNNSFTFSSRRKCHME